QQGAYENETHVRETIVRPILRELGWDIEDPQQLQPEYRLKDGTRLDYGLSIDGKLRVIIEVKAVGNLKEADLQLFQYAFHAGTPLALLTDGREWQFYYVYGTGDYPDRLVRILDILEHEIDEVMHYLSRYLAFEEVKLERAEKSAKKDLQDKTNREAAKKAIPKAWQRLAVYEPNEQLVNLLTEETAQEAGGGAPNKDDVIAFLQNLTPSSATYALPQTLAESPRAVYKPLKTPAKTKAKPQKSNESSSKQGQKRTIIYKLLGVRKACSNATLAYAAIIKSLTHRDPKFLDRLAYKLGEKQLSREKFRRSIKIGDWHINTDIANSNKIKHLEIACEVAGIKFGKDLTLQKSSKKLSSYKFSASLGGATNESVSAIEIYVEIMEILASKYPNLLNQLVSKLGTKQLSQDKANIIEPIKLSNGWFLTKALNNPAKKKFLTKTCEIAGIKAGRGKDLEFDFPNA
ncbi:MAG: type I restriction enzyme HsdR N-terminal domain-containing protein, partial [Alphaproteobacteria bacterium]|nr:type I restriction enzyme HsdR N-terminal domain-containing protein [Alphaproteobacteria bacterium]